MGIFDKLKEPVIYKEDSTAIGQIEILKNLMPRLNQEGKELLEKDIRILEYGIQGENSILFELKNSHMPMYVLHDVFLEKDGLQAQIDFIVITRKCTFIIECKNLYGDIEINSNGDFIRTMAINGKKYKEGIYSPITQNIRHIELIKSIKRDKQSNFITKIMVDKYFDCYHKSIVVLANPKTILNAKFAKKDVKSQIIRADQLNTYIQNFCKQSKESDMSDSDMLSVARSYVEDNKINEQNYLKKYEKYLLPVDESTKNLVIRKTAEIVDLKTENKKSEVVRNDNIGVVQSDELISKLKEYRLKKSCEEGNKPYYIFNDKQMMDLIDKNPRTNEQLMQVNGFGPAKVEKYGKAILDILEKYN